MHLICGTNFRSSNHLVRQKFVFIGWNYDAINWSMKRTMDRQRRWEKMLQQKNYWISLIRSASGLDKDFFLWSVRLGGDFSYRLLWLPQFTAQKPIVKVSLTKVNLCIWTWIMVEPHGDSKRRRWKMVRTFSELAFQLQFVADSEIWGFEDLRRLPINDSALKSEEIRPWRFLINRNDVEQHKLIH